MSPLFKIPAASGHLPIFKAGEQGIRWLGLEVVRLAAGERWQSSLEDEEAGLVILGGRCTVVVDAKERAEWAALGNRSDIFAGLPTAVYVPRRSTLSITAETALEAAIMKAPCDVDLPPALVTPADVKVISAGMANWRRDVRLVIPPGSPISQRLIIGETINPPGNWSGIPPHKHDEITQAENSLEEVYLFKAKPADGYGVQLMYRSGEGSAHLIGNDDVAVMLGGFHPTVAAPGVTIAYLWTLAGDSKAYNLSIDPRFSWVSSAEAVFREMKQQ